MITKRLSKLLVCQSFELEKKFKLKKIIFLYIIKDATVKF